MRVREARMGQEETVQLFGIELREILMRRKGILLILLFLGMYSVSLWNENGSEIDRFYDQWKTDEILAELEGPLNEEKAALVQQVIMDYEEALRGLEREKSRYLSGKTDRKEYVEASEKYVETLREYQLTRIVSDAYDYVREDPQNRYFANQNGWNWFLGRESVGVLYGILVMILLIPIFTAEAESGIHGLLRSCEEGCGRLFGIRIISGVWIAVVCMTSAVLLELWVAEIRYGLAPWDYPVQSLSLYQYYEGEMTIGGMAARMILCRLMGSIYFAVFCLMISMVCRNGVSSFVMIGLFHAAPWFLLERETMYRCPLTLPLTEAAIYVQGYRSAATGEIVYMEAAEIAGVYLLAFIIGITVIAIGWAVYHEKMRLPKCMHLTIGMITLLLCSGCADADFSGEYVVNPAIYGYLVTGDRFAVIACEQPYLLLDGETGDVTELFTDPFYDGEKYSEITPMYFEENILYYLKRSGDYESLWRMDCENREQEKLVNLGTSQPEGLNLWNLLDEEGKYAYDLYTSYETQCQRYYLYQNRIYVLTGEGLVEYDSDGNRIGLLLSGLVDQPAFYRGYFYYRDSYGFLNEYNCISGESRNLSESLVSGFFVGQDTLFFIDVSGNLYRMSLHEDGQEWMQKNVERLLFAAGDKIYYLKKRDDTIYVNTAGTERIISAEDKGILQFGEVNGEYMTVIWDSSAGKAVWELID